MALAIILSVTMCWCAVVLLLSFNANLMLLYYQTDKESPFFGFNEEQFRHCCVMCSDYFRIPKVGLFTAAKLFNQCRSAAAAAAAAAVPAAVTAVDLVKAEMARLLSSYDTTLAVFLVLLETKKINTSNAVEYVKQFLLADAAFVCQFVLDVDALLKLEANPNALCQSLYGHRKSPDSLPAAHKELLTTAGLLQFACGKLPPSIELQHAIACARVNAKTLAKFELVCIGLIFFLFIYIKIIVSLFYCHLSSQRHSHLLHNLLHNSNNQW
jgi:hypothetical protein